MKVCRSQVVNEGHANSLHFGIGVAALFDRINRVRRQTRCTAIAEPDPAQNPSGDNWSPLRIVAGVRPNGRPTAYRRCHQRSNRPGPQMGLMGRSSSPGGDPVDPGLPGGEVAQRFGVGGLACVLQSALGGGGDARSAFSRRAPPPRPDPRRHESRLPSLSRLQRAEFSSASSRPHLERVRSARSSGRALRLTRCRRRRRNARGVVAPKCGGRADCDPFFVREAREAAKCCRGASSRRRPCCVGRDAAPAHARWIAPFVSSPLSRSRLMDTDEDGSCSLDRQLRPLRKTYLTATKSMASDPAVCRAARRVAPAQPLLILRPAILRSALSVERHDRGLHRRVHRPTSFAAPPTRLDLLRRRLSPAPCSSRALAAASTEALRLVGDWRRAGSSNLLPHAARSVVEKC